MNDIMTTASPATALRTHFASRGITVAGVPNDLSWDGAMAICGEVLRQTRDLAPEVAEALDRGDYCAAADAYLARYHPEQVS